jgi:hypothetical protein
MSNVTSMRTTLSPRSSLADVRLRRDASPVSRARAVSRIFLKMDAIDDHSTDRRKSKVEPAAQRPSYTRGLRDVKYDIAAPITMTTRMEELRCV